MSGFSLSSEPFTLARDCGAVMVPQGESVTLPAGQVGYITQALGGSFTVYVEGNLFRIAGNDADALGKEPPPPLELADSDKLEQGQWAIAIGEPLELTQTVTVGVVSAFHRSEIGRAHV